jgi:hypothetical protein
MKAKALKTGPAGIRDVKERIQRPEALAAKSNGVSARSNARVQNWQRWRWRSLEDIVF